MSGKKLPVIDIYCWALRATPVDVAKEYPRAKPRKNGILVVLQGQPKTRDRKTYDEALACNQMAFGRSEIVKDDKTWGPGDIECRKHNGLATWPRCTRCHSQGDDGEATIQTVTVPTEPDRFGCAKWTGNEIEFDRTIGACWWCSQRQQCLRRKARMVITNKREN